MAPRMCDCATCAAHKDGAKEMDDRIWLHAGPRYLLDVTAG